METNSMRTTLKLITIVALTAAAGCATPRTAPAPGAISPDAVEMAKTRWPGASAQTLEEGRGIFLSSCNKCHGYPDRSAYADEKWPGIIERMGKKAKLSPEQAQLVLRFIQATRTGG
jgi:mono/diheme cytochrome c family protein